MRLKSAKKRNKYPLPKNKTLRQENVKSSPQYNRDAIEKLEPIAGPAGCKQFIPRATAASIIGRKITLKEMTPLIVETIK